MWEGMRVRLGLTNSTYQYLFADGSFFPDRTDPAFAWRGQPLPYFVERPRLDPATQLEWLIQRCVQLELPVCHAGVRSWDDPAYLARIKELLRRHRIELMPAIGANLISSGDTAKQVIEGAVATLRRYRDFGDVAICKYCTVPMVHTRFTTDPPLDEQLALIIENSRPIVTVAEECGIVLAFENHLDYRAREIVQVIKAVDSPNLRFLFDTGNTLTVCEDPVDAALDAAPYTVLVHLKDLRVLPWTPQREFVSVMYAAPLGRGHVNNRKVLEIMREQAPDPINLCLSLELMPMPPNEDEDRWVEASIAYAKEAFAEFLQ
jgi:sugar phosphate isomerase/epimerase